MKKSSIAILILLFVIIGLGLWLQHSLAKIASLESTGGKIPSEYRREAEVLDKTADEVKKEIEKAPATSGATVKFAPKRKAKSAPAKYGDITPYLADTTAGCFQCLESVEINYAFDNSYIVLKDLLVFDPESQSFVSKSREFRITEEFNKLLVKEGIENFIKHDTKLFRMRWGLSADYAWSIRKDFPGIGFGPSLEFMNLQKWTKIKAGVYTGVYVVPSLLMSSHGVVGLDWRFFRNMAMGLAFSRSAKENQITAALIFYPFD